MTCKHAATLLRAFGDPTRLRVLNILGQRDMTVGALARLLRCPRPRLSRHLQYLRARGIVDFDRRGNGAVYHLAPPQDGLHQRTLAAVLTGIADTREARRDSQRLTQQAAPRGRR